VPFFRIVVQSCHQDIVAHALRCVIQDEPGVDVDFRRSGDRSFQDLLPGGQDVPVLRNAANLDAAKLEA